MIYNLRSKKVYHRQKKYETYNHGIVSGFIITLGIIFLVGISEFPRNILVFIGFCCLAVFAYKLTKTTKPITISGNSICLGKMLVGFKSIQLLASDISKIELVNEKRTEDSTKAIYTGGVVEVISNYYLIYLNNNTMLKFDNFYDDNLKLHIKEWCQSNNVEVNLEINKIVDNSIKPSFE